MKKDDFISIVFGDRAGSSIYYHADTGGGEDALPDAYPGIAVRIYLRLAVWSDRRFVTPLLRGAMFGMAGNFPECGMYGI